MEIKNLRYKQEHFSEEFTSEDVKMGKGFEAFMKNPYWKEYYENAPSDKLKEFITLMFEYSYRVQNDEDDVDDCLYAEHKRIENELSVADFQYLIKYAGIVQAKIHYHQKIREIIEESGLFTLFHIPHDGRCFPSELMSSVIVPSNEFLSYHNKMRDAEVNRFVPEITQSETIAFGISRLLCDVERLVDGTEIMEKYGMGFCYEKVYDGTTIKIISEELKKRTYEYYEAHHRKIDDLARQRRKGLLLIDLHSFSEEIIVNELKDNTKRFPDVCLGYNETYCPQILLNIAQKCFSGAGLSVEINYPYSGSYVPDSVISGQTKTQFASIMIEVNKKLYMRGVDDEMDYSAVWKVKNAIFQTIALFSECQ